MSELSPEELRQKQLEKYGQMDEKQLQALMAQKLIGIGKEEEKVRLITESIKQSTEQLVHYQKVLVGLVIGSAVIFVAYIGFKLLQVYIAFRKFISWVNSAQISPTTWPTGGFGTALCIQYPFLTGMMGFRDAYLPIAAYITWVQYATTPLGPGKGTVSDNATRILSGMFMFAQLGGAVTTGACAGTGGNDIPAWQIICCGWGNAFGVQPCSGVYCDREFSTGDWINAGTSAIGQGTQGAFTASMFKGGAASSGIGFVVMAGVQMGLSLWQTYSEKEAAANSNGCNGSTVVTPQ